MRPGEESVGEIIKNPQVLVRVAPTDVSANAVRVEVKGFEFAPADRLLTHRGKLGTTQLDEKQTKVEAYALTPAWTPVENADYYEVKFDGQIYSTIREPRLRFDDLAPVTAYDFAVRAVNASAPAHGATSAFRP